MTLIDFNRKTTRGASFIEALAVTVIIGGVLAAMGTTFIYGLKSYVGEYASESGAVEAQRALSEFNYFGSHSMRYLISDDGNTVAFYKQSGAVQVFNFIEDSTNGGVSQGRLELVLESGTRYIFAGTYFVTGSAFQVVHGGLSFFFTIDSSGGPVAYRSLVYPALAL